MRHILIGAVAVSLMLHASAAAAQVKYIDRAGMSHWVQSESQIPEEFRARASRPALPGVGTGDDQQRSEYQEQLAGETKDRERARAIAERQAQAEERRRILKARELMKDALDISAQGRRRP